MKFQCGQIWCGGGDWAIIGQFVSIQGDAHSVGFSLLGYDVTYDASVCDLDVLGNLVSMYEESCVCNLYVSYTLEKSYYLSRHSDGTFWLVWTLNEVYVFLGLDCLWSDDIINLPCMGGDLTCYFVCDFPILSYMEHCHGWGIMCWNLSGWCDGGHMFRH